MLLSVIMKRLTGVTVILNTFADGGDATGDTITGFENLIGGSGSDTLTSDGNANVIEGGAGADTLTGGGGADTISDGTGADIIIGGDGADIIILAADSETDVLVYNALSEAGDTVTGFDVSDPTTGGDIIDLADLLSTGDFAGSSLSDAITGGYVTLTDNSGDAEVWVDLDGSGGGGSAVLLATLNGVDLIADANVLDDNIIVV